VTGPTCADVAGDLPGLTDGSAELSSAARSHVQRCLHCQAELVHYRRVLRILRSLRSEVVEPPPGALAAALASLRDAGVARAERGLLGGRRAAYLSGVLVATAASAAGALVWATRRRLEVAS
jgi:hypothetical protein